MHALTLLRRLVSISLLLALLVVPAGTAAQDEFAGSQAPALGPELVPEGVWQVRAYDPWGEGLAEPLPGSTLELALLSDGRLEGDTACGRFSGGYFLEGERLNMGIVSRPLEPCGPRQDDETFAFSAAIDAVVAWRAAADGSGLELLDAGERVRLVLQRTADGDATGDWLVTTYVRPNGKPATPSPEYPMRLAISADGRVFGSTGCRFFEGEHRGEGDAIFIGPIELIGQPCEGPLRRSERQLLAAMEQVTRWQREGETLVLIDAFESPVIELQPAPEGLAGASPEAGASAEPERPPGAGDEP